MSGDKESISLRDDEKTCLQILRACTGLPMFDLGGRLTKAGLLDERGLLTEEGRRIADELLKHED